MLISASAAAVDRKGSVLPYSRVRRAHSAAMSRRGGLDLGVELMWSGLPVSGTVAHAARIKVARWRARTRERPDLQLGTDTGANRTTRQHSWRRRTVLLT